MRSPQARFARRFKINCCSAVILLLNYVGFLCGEFCSRILLDCSTTSRIGSTWYGSWRSSGTPACFWSCALGRSSPPSGTLGQLPLFTTTIGSTTPFWFSWCLIRVSWMEFQRRAGVVALRARNGFPYEQWTIQGAVDLWISLSFWGSCFCLVFNSSDYFSGCRAICRASRRTSWIWWRKSSSLLRREGILS